MTPEFAQNACVQAIPLGGSLRQILAPFVRLAARLVGRESAWERVMMPVPASVFGPGSHQPFPEYFQGESCVRVGSIDEIVAWLQTCEYIPTSSCFTSGTFGSIPGSSRN